MKSIDLWNQLINEGEQVSNDIIFPSRDIYIYAKGKNNSKRRVKIQSISNINSKISIYATEPIYYSRFNQGVVTINLVDVGLAAEKDLEKFWKIFDERLELCHRALQFRHERLANTYSDTSPIHWQHGAIARLPKNTCIHDLLHDGYSTISLGYAGLWECVYALTNSKLTQPEGKHIGLKIMQYMNDKCNQWKAEENILYTVHLLNLPLINFQNHVRKDMELLKVLLIKITLLIAIIFT